MARLGSFVRTARRLLGTPQGRSAGGKAVDGAAGIAHRMAGERHASKVERARQAAQRGLRSL
jgi:hypothetical protein